MQSLINIDNFIVALTVMLFSFFYILDENGLVSIILFIITLVILLLIAFKNHGRIPLHFDYYQVFVLLFVLFSFLSSIWAWEKTYSIEKAVTIFEILVCMTVFYSYFYKQKNGIDTILNILIYAALIVLIYTYYHYGIVTIFNTIRAGTRLDNSYTNINSIGMLGSVFCILIINKTIIKKKWFLLVLLIPAIIIIIAAGSRKAVLMLLLGSFLITISNDYNKNYFKKIIYLFFVIIAFYFLIHYLINIQVLSGTFQRLQGLFSMITGDGIVDHSTWLRQQYSKVGMEQFKKTPILGIGIGNSRILINAAFGRDTYTHNNYVELLAGGGIIGFTCYYVMYIYLGISYYLNRRDRDSNYAVIIVLTILQLVMDFGAVSYYSKYTYFYLLLFFLYISQFGRIRNSRLVKDKGNY